MIILFFFRQVVTIYPQKLFSIRIGQFQKKIVHLLFENLKLRSFKRIFKFFNLAVTFS